jgi:anti-sigma-K factor RskA
MRVMPEGQQETDPLKLMVACQERVNVQIQRVQDAPNRDIAAKEAAILGAVSTREMWSVMLAAVKTLNHETSKLAVWTAVLAVGTILLFAATFGLVYVEWHKEPPQVITIPAPTAPTTVVIQPLAVSPTPGAAKK